MAASDTVPAVTLHAGTALRGWGGLGVPGREAQGEDLRALTEGVPTLSRGMGRSYGDASLPPPGVTAVVGTRRANRVISFDPDTGLLVAEAGLSLREIVDVFLPRGFFPPVSPGTWFVTLGGAVASDIHGKNHHVAGTFGAHVQWVVMRVASGDIVRCSRTEHPELFLATLGGMGLTGHVLEVAVTLQNVSSPWIWREAMKVPTFDALLDGLETSSDWEQTVAWIDTLATGRSFGRGVLMRGRWARPWEAPAHFPPAGIEPVVPFNAPSFLLNDWTVKAFNELYYHKQVFRNVVGPVTPRGWFTPLDAVHHWYRAYGRAGFTQHQSVIPRSAGREAVRTYCETLAAHGGTGFLCVIKDCGAEGDGLLSFPEPGMSVALDLPNTPDTPALVDLLNEMTIERGGRIYLTKDTFTRREHFEAMEAARLPRFRAVRDTWDPTHRIKSAMSVRLFGDEP